MAYIPLFAAAKKSSLSQKVNFAQCVLLTENFAFRALTIGQMDTAELERKLGESARIIWNSGSMIKFRDYLKSQIDDARFEEQFARHSERRVKIQYYVLRELEKQLLGGGKGVVPGDHHSAKNHIEHILPKRLSRAKGRMNEWNWARANTEKHRGLVNRLGNLLVLEGDINKAVSNHEFSVKQKGKYKKSKSGKVNQIKCYKDSALRWPKIICDVKLWGAWTEAEIDARQKRMAEAALEIWSII